MALTAFPSVPGMHTYLAPDTRALANTAGSGSFAVYHDQGFSIAYTVSTLPAEPLIRGTSIPIFRVAALLKGGMTVNQVLEDFPSLTRGDVEGAEEYADTHVNVWREYPKVSLKRLLQNSGFSEL
jgi:uncharacterized protein (DUF433 family)